MQNYITERTCISTKSDGKEETWQNVKAILEDIKLEHNDKFNIRTVGFIFQQEPILNQL